MHAPPPVDEAAAGVRRPNAPLAPQTGDTLSGVSGKPKTHSVSDSFQSTAVPITGAFLVDALMLRAPPRSSTV
jgi:hypothetical protein